MTNTVSINIPQLRKHCYEGFEYYRRMGESVVTKNGNYTFIDRGANVLGIAHLDTVMGYKGAKGKFRIYGRTVVSSELDDRLGVYILLEELPKLGVNFDILFTEGEEQGRSTAKFFESKKQYNWMFQFDRRNLFPVLYDYDTPDLRRKLFAAGVQRVDHGSFSDICSLEHLGCSGINFGAGYDNEHTYKCYARLSTTEKSISWFKNFYDLYKDELLVYTPRPAVSYIQRYGGGYDEWNDFKYRPKHKETLKPDEMWVVKCVVCQQWVPEEEYSYRVSCCYSCILGMGGL